MNKREFLRTKSHKNKLYNLDKAGDNDKIKYSITRDGEFTPKSKNLLTPFAIISDGSGHNLSFDTIGGQVKVHLDDEDISALHELLKFYARENGLDGLYSQKESAPLPKNTDSTYDVDDYYFFSPYFMP